MSPEKKKLIADLVKMAKKNPELFCPHWLTLAIRLQTGIKKNTN